MLAHTFEPRARAVRWARAVLASLLFVQNAVKVGAAKDTLEGIEIPDPKSGPDQLFDEDLYKTYVP